MDIGASFMDSVVAALARDQELLASCVGEPLWDEDRRTLLIRIEPRNPEASKSVADAAVEAIRQIRGFKFTAEVQGTEIKGKPNFIFKLTVKK